MGDLKELDGFKVHGIKHGKDNPTLQNGMLIIKNTKGINSEVYYALRPISDLFSAYAELEIEVMVKGSKKGAFGVHFGVWWHLQSDSIVPDLDGAAPISLAKNEWQNIKFTYDRGKCSIEINKQKKLTIDVPINVHSRPIIIGNIHDEYSNENEGECMIRKINQSINDPYYNRKFKWSWTPNDGFPDKCIDSHFLELKNADMIENCDFGYSGWTELSDGEFLCTYYHYEGDDYIPQKSTYIIGTYFSEQDFS